MATTFINFTLPEFVFLDASGHDGGFQELEGRTVIQHVRSYSVFEVLALNEVMMHNLKTATYEFTYKNKFGITEKHLLALHFTAGIKDDDTETLKEIFQKTAQWYCKYLDWEDDNINEDINSVHN